MKVEAPGSRSFSAWSARRVVRRFPRLRTVPAGLHTDWQADLAILDDLHVANDGFRYLLVCVGVLSRQLFVEPVRTKRSADMIDAFERLFRRARVLSWRLVTDQGLEFTATAMCRYFREKDVLAHSTYTHPAVHAGVVERANRTTKERLYRYLIEHKTTRWVDVIHQMVSALNRSVCRATGVAPADVNFENAASLRPRLYGQEPPKAGRVPSIKGGDCVRIEKRKQAFEKGYLPRFTDELFMVTKVRLTPQPAPFALRDEAGEPVRGWFYANELCPVRKDAHTVYRVERVLKTRKSKRGGIEHYVKWLNRSTIYNALVHESEYV